VRRSEHERILALQQQGNDLVVKVLENEILFLKEQNADLLNRAMSQDWTQYTALSAVPIELAEIPERIWDPTGLIEVDLDPDE
jgi:hypothetical protein